MKSDVSETKAALRQQAYAARKSAFDARAETGAVARATEHLLAEIGQATGLRITAYMPILSELDPRPAMHTLHRQGAELAVPVIKGPGRPLRFRRWTPEVPMIEGPFGALVPAMGDWVVPEVLIVPLVAFDRSCQRLGYGGGFYDRTLAALRAVATVRALGFAYAAQELSSLPLEPTDQPLDAIVTEKSIVRPDP